MKLAFCLFKYFSFGGLQRDFLRIALECVKRGHKVDVFTMSWDGEKHSGININLVPKKGLQNHSIINNFINNIKLKIKNYDLVVGFNKIPGLDIYYAADVCYQDKMNSQRSFWHKFTNRYRSLLKLEKSVFERTHSKILILCKKQQNDFVKYYGTPVSNFYLLPPGISKDRVAPVNFMQVKNDYRKNFNISNDEIILLMVGSGFKTKGLDRAILGIASLPDNIRMRAKLFIIGQDNPTKFQKQANNLGIKNNIIFLGGRSDVAKFFLIADLLLHPAYSENTGTVLLEALASGLPVLTTDICGYAHYIKQANAGTVLSSPFNQNNFNKTIVNMLLSKNYMQWKLNAINYSKNNDLYSLHIKAVDYIEKIYRE
ncbi:glycosyltransferase family 4 protein [Gammaproteobacteria bacterium]|nr:glycosyltransferase family 4 protein [Gammaproteobacteria bacterium]